MITPSQVQRLTAIGYVASERLGEPCPGCMIDDGERTIIIWPEALDEAIETAIRHVEALHARSLAVAAGAKPAEAEAAHPCPTPDDFTDLAAAALGTRTADVQAEVDAECDEAPDAITVPSVAALRTGATVRVAARRAIEAIAAQTGEHAWQVAVRMRRRQIAAQKVAAVPVRDLPDGEVMP